MATRRKFIKNAVLTTAGVSLGLSARAYGNIVGANDRVNVAAFGLNGRGIGLTTTFAGTDNCRVYGLGDVDTRAYEKTREELTKAGHKKPKVTQDFRRLLDDRRVDAVVIATPDHWHAPMSIMALDAGKHVYVEKPCSHNPAEGGWLIEKQLKTGLRVQMGNQTRSSITGNKIVKEIHDGLIGEAYAGKAWYANTRKGLPPEQQLEVPEWLDWELWQGPAPRRDYQNNIVHYDWHWKWDYGTGELLNNGTHEIDMCRWALQVDYPEKVSSTGGRFHFDDSWETYDTQVVGYEFPEGKMINWEGRSCNGMPYWDRGRGALIHGTKGSVLLDREGYWVYDLRGKEIRSEQEAGKSVSMDVRGGGSLDQLHIRNFIDSIVTDVPLNSPIIDANVSVDICHLGNMAQRVGETLRIDAKTGKPDSEAAMQLWERTYADGWKPRV